MFTATEALGLVMAVLDGHHSRVTDATDPVGSALGKMMRVLPESVAGPAETVWKVSARDRAAGARSPDPEITSALVRACDSRRRLSLRYRMGSRGERDMEVDPWAVVVRRGRWSLLCWSHTRDARRVLRVDRVVDVEVCDGTFTPPAELNPVEALEEHLSQG